VPESPSSSASADLGLGGKLSSAAAHLLNHDGTFNVRRNDLGPFHPFNAYHALLAAGPSTAGLDGCVLLWST
jgi:hypothetical protein